MQAEISAQLPVPEDEFTYMRVRPARPVFPPELRAGVPGACAAESMFAGLVHSAELWGEATRWACDERRHGADGPSLFPAASSPSAMIGVPGGVPAPQARKPALAAKRLWRDNRIGAHVVASVQYIHLLCMLFIDKRPVQ
jgi:hypothetical protein